MSRMKRNSLPKERLRRLATAGVLTAAAMILSWIEAILPFSIGIPGVKLGLCHIVTLLAVYRLTAWESVAVTVVRILLTSFLFGNVASLAYSAAGGIVSLGLMLLLQRIGRRREKPLFSPLGISVVGAVSHNLAQLATAALLMQTAGLLSYLPLLLIAGVLTGTVIGAVASLVLHRVHQAGKTSNSHKYF